MCHYEYLVMPFGLMNAPATFQSTMNDVFRSCLRKFVLVFFDDILVYNPNWETHLLHLAKVLQLLKINRLVVNEKKCSFGRKSIDYLGHQISGEGVSMDPEKIVNVLNWPTPKNVKGVRGFLGLTRYYRKFIKDYGKIAKPLTELTKKDNFHWSQGAQVAFETLKKVMTSTPVLVLPDFTQLFEIECDASGKGIGAVLMQHKRPIAYFSKALSKKALSKAAYDKEIMALAVAVQHWRPYPLGRHFLVYIDQKSLKHLLHQRITTADQQNWIAKLLGYSFDIIYKPGPENKAADALSRIPYVSEFHATPHGGHSGFLRTYRRLAANLYWVGMKKHVQDYVQSCDVCQRQKYAALSPGGLLQPLDIPNQIWEDLSMDFITGLPKSRGFEAILVVVDRLSKYAHFLPLKHPYTAKGIAEVFAREIVRLHGIPNSIASDRDPIFISHFWRELFRLQGTTLRMSSTYHPETDGQTEVVNRCLETYLRCFISEQPRAWSQWVSWAELWYNTTFHISTKSTPFEVVYGRNPPSLTHYLPGETRVEAVARELLDRGEILRQLKYHLHRAQQQMKIYANQKRRDLSFEIDECVFLKLRPHRQQSVVKRVN
uniref:Retrovirus-related Pol polyprotein from transposon 297 family n=1 Tax=Cajanus cajan TaxID=3821 RepID=A0A151QWC6_CAJCA|nr:Retrovirus-related Pol polyprotein from transposon 297 family [Cajanus cajan]